MLKIQISIPLTKYLKETEQIITSQINSANKSKTVYENSLKLMHINIQSLTNKLEKLEVISDNHNADIICVSEHFQNKNIDLLKLKNSTVQSFFSRIRFRGGGVAIFCKDTLPAEKIIFNNSVDKVFEMSAKNVKLIII